MFFDYNSDEWTAREPVVETVVVVGVGAFAGTVVDPVKLPAKLPRYSTSPSRPEV